MSKSLIGQIVRHEGQIFQILSETGSILRACSYSEDFNVETTIFVSKATGKVIARKETNKKRESQ